MIQKVLVVGSGITGLITAFLLQLKQQNIQITIWEKMNTAGGRFCTVKYEESVNPKLFADVGAQFITVSDEVIYEHNEVYSGLFQEGLLVKMDPDIFVNFGLKPPPVNKTNYVAPLGMESIVNYFISKFRDLDFSFNFKLERLEQNVNKWTATGNATSTDFDVVILTIPPPEILKIEGSFKNVISKENIKCLEEVEYSRRHASALFFDKFNEKGNDFHFINNDTCLRFIATDRWRYVIRNKKAERDTQLKFKSVAVHTSTDFSESNSESVSSIEPVIMKHIEKHFPHWPKPNNVYTLFWKYSQVRKPYFLKPGAILFNKNPLLIAGGDGFINSTFNDCVISAKKIVDIITNN